MVTSPSKRASGKQTEQEQQEASLPPYYIAEQPLFIGGSQFARAFNPGDRVPADHVEEHGWHDLVSAPEGYDAPEKPSNDKPETPEGQATSSKEGEA